MLAADVIIAAASRIMYPDHHDGDHHNDPESLIVLEDAAALASVIIVATHIVLTSLIGFSIHITQEVLHWLQRFLRFSLCIMAGF